MGETKLLVCNERLEVPQADGEYADQRIRYVGTMAMQSTAWSPIEMDGVLMSDQDVRYFHFGIEIHVPVPGPESTDLVPALVPTCKFTTPINVESDYRKALGQLTTLFLRQRYTSLADVTACLIRPTMDFREKIEKTGTAAGASCGFVQGEKLTNVLKKFKGGEVTQVNHAEGDEDDTYDIKVKTGKAAVTQQTYVQITGVACGADTSMAQKVRRETSGLWERGGAAYSVGYGSVGTTSTSTAVRVDVKVCGTAVLIRCLYNRHLQTDTHLIDSNLVLTLFLPPRLRRSRSSAATFPRATR
jgi:hypothetical protein